MNQPDLNALFERSTRLQLAFAFQHGYSVLPVSGAHSITFYAIYRRNQLVARCDRLDDAAEVAAALAAYHPLAPMGAISSQSQAGESLAPGLAQGGRE